MSFVCTFALLQAEEKKLEAAEKYLEESATMFDEFLKENDKNAVEAIKMYVHVHVVLIIGCVWGIGSRTVMMMCICAYIQG